MWGRGRLAAALAALDRVEVVGRGSCRRGVQGAGRGLANPVAGTLLRHDDAKQRVALFRPHLAPQVWAVILPLNLSYCNSAPCVMPVSPRRHPAAPRLHHGERGAGHRRLR